MDLSDWVKVMEQIARDKYEGNISNNNINEDYIRKTYNELNGGLKKGFNNSSYELEGALNNISPEALKMKQNIFKFSGAKNYAMLEDMNAILTSEKGKSWNSFYNEVLKLNSKYNKNYLQAEWQTAKQAGYHGANWEAYQRNKDKFPNLKYKTQNDGRVREEHQLLNGIIAPIDGDFWKTHYPPNGWRCRCYTVQTAKEPTEAKKIPVLNEKEHKKEFRNNVGVSGDVFLETDKNKGKAHPYFALFKSANSEIKKAFEYSKLAAKKELAYKNGDAKVKVSPFADVSDFEDNFKDAKLIVDSLKLDVDIEAHLEGKVVSRKNPEYLIGNKVADRKAPVGLKYKNILRKAAAQKCEYVVINNIRNNDNLKNIKHKLKNILKNNNVHPSIQNIIIIVDGKIKQFKRDEL